MASATKASQAVSRIDSVGQLCLQPRMSTATKASGPRIPAYARPKMCVLTAASNFAHALQINSSGRSRGGDVLSDRLGSRV